LITKKRQFGDFGEAIAVKFLMKRGFAVVERNYLKPWGEIDIIAKKDEVFHFVEVKTAEDGNLGKEVIHETSFRPEENIHPKKLERMNKAIQTYCMEKRISEDKVAIDAVIVRIGHDHKKAKVIFMENIVL
jgi:putative endonuclease